MSWVWVLVSAWVVVAVALAAVVSRTIHTADDREASAAEEPETAAEGARDQGEHGPGAVARAPRLPPPRGVFSAR